MTTTPGLFDEFAEAEAALKVEQRTHATHLKAVAIARKAQRLTLRRAKSESVLSDILPATLEPDTSYHVISHGDVDALSYLIHILRTQPLSRVLIATWCMAMPDIEYLRGELENYRIDHVDFVLGEIFPSTYPDEYEAVKRMQDDGIATMKIARCHAKIMAGSDPDSGFYFAIESSANVNTNPRIEQTAIHASRDLHDFYVDFFNGLKSIDAASSHAAGKRRAAAKHANTFPPAE